MAAPARSRNLVLVAAAFAAATVVAVVGMHLASAAPVPSPSAVALVISPSPLASAVPPAAPLPIDTPVPVDTPLPSDSPLAPASPTPSPTATPVYHGPFTATRVVVPALGIDLAITKSPPAGVYPYCNVAMMFGKPFGLPGQKQATYLFAHARDGMFGPIYELTMVRRTPSKMVGMEVDVYTSDSRMHVYRITKVLPHQLTLNTAFNTHRDQVWLQTSEGPHGTPGKTQVVADPVSVRDASYGASHPKVRIVKCGT